MSETTQQENQPLTAETTHTDVLVQALARGMGAAMKKYEGQKITPFVALMIAGTARRTIAACLSEAHGAEVDIDQHFTLTVSPQGGIDITSVTEWGKNLLEAAKAA